MQDEVNNSDRELDEADQVCLKLDARQFSRAAILRASYWLSKDLDIEIPPSESDTRIQVVLRAKSTIPTLDNPRSKNLHELVSEFHEALIDAELRVQVLRETAAVREMLLAKALAEAGILEGDPPGSFEDPVMEHDRTATAGTLVTIRNEEAS
jgi:His-Xaa-Ser system protein HxsD